MDRRMLFLSMIVPAIGGLGASHKTTRHSDDALASGLKIWRKPGAIQQGASCATCHSPDGIELAEYAFDDADLRRRARRHLDESDTDQLVAYIHALRSELKITHLRDPERDRPLQPGGEVLPGATSAERDLAFGKELQLRLPLLFDKIDSLAQARAAEKELLNVSPISLKIGIPLNRLSEDVAHGNVHSSIAQWLPENPPTMDAADQPRWYAAEDAYLQNPSQSELHKLLNLHSQLVNTNRMRGLPAISTAKFRALLVLQDRMRHGTESEPVNVSPDVLEYSHFNPIWQVGEFARTCMGQDPETLGMDADTQTEKTAGPSLDEQMHELRASWFWAGWLSDQGLFRTAFDGKTKLGLWMSESLSKDGPYPFHNVYANARRQAVVSNASEAWGETPERRRRIWDFAGLRSFQQYLTDMPKDPEYKALYTKFTANCFRMNLLLLKDNISQTHEVWMKLNTKAIVSELIAFLKIQDPSSAGQADTLQQEIFSLTDGAKERI